MYFNRFRISTKFKSLEAVRNRRTLLSRTQYVSVSSIAFIFTQNTFAICIHEYDSALARSRRQRLKLHICGRICHPENGLEVISAAFDDTIRMCDKSPPIKSHFFILFFINCPWLDSIRNSLYLSFHFVLPLSLFLFLSLPIFSPRSCVREWAENINTLRGHLSLSLQWAARHEDKKKRREEIGTKRIVHIQYAHESRVSLTLVTTIDKEQPWS